jgi:uncharacterized membrane protein (DUF4010 family)
MDENWTSLARLGLALGLGLIVGLERGWSQREQREGSRVAGLRTFGIIGLAGGLVATMAQRTDWLVLTLAFPAIALGIVYAFWRARRTSADVGATTLLAALATLAIGVLAVLGAWIEATAAGIVLALVLGMKPELHHWLQHLNKKEVMAVLQLLLISAVLLPALPDRGYGPWQALNPRHIWLMVVLITGISFVGYVAVRTAGARSGALMTGLFGGLVSSTAVTLSLARQARGADDFTAKAQAAAAAMACSMMFARMALVAVIINPSLARHLAPALGAAALAGFVASALIMPRGKAPPTAGQVPPRNPFELGMALQFGALLAVVSLAASGLRHWLGDAGLIVLGAASGLADVDAITVSLANLAEADAVGGIVTLALLLAASSNSLVKVAIGFTAGGGAFGKRLAGAMAAALLAGAVCLAVAPGGI